MLYRQSKLVYLHQYKKDFYKSSSCGLYSFVYGTDF